MTPYEPQPDPAAGCSDPTHDPKCPCGARPDYEYEHRVEAQR